MSCAKIIWGWSRSTKCHLNAIQKESKNCDITMWKWVLYNPTIDAYSQYCVNYTYRYFSVVIIMIVLHNSDHSMSISDIVMCVRESLNRGGCSGASGSSSLIQPHKTMKEGKEYHWPVCLCQSPWPAWREHHNVCSDYPTRRHPSPCYCCPLQHCPSFLDTLHNTLIPPDQIDSPEPSDSFFCLFEKAFYSLFAA